MEENKQVESDSSGYLPKIDEDDNQTYNREKDNINHQDTPAVDVKNGNAKTTNAIGNTSANSDNQDDALTQGSSGADIPRLTNTYSNNIVDEISDESGMIGRDTVLKRYHELSRKSGKKGQKRIEANFFSIIVIAYTILLLVLGFFVYRDVSKRLSNIENRVSAIEVLLMKNQKLTIDNIKIYDVE